VARASCPWYFQTRAGSPCHYGGRHTLNLLFRGALVGIDSVKLAEHLWDRQRIVVIPIKHEQFEAIRVTPNVDSTLDEVDIFVDAMKRALTKGV
jgi:selenocysteine lyase/cysteine desulfurase